jgi:spore germination cell wall hydrolase CwlJ-like protein
MNVLDKSIVEAIRSAYAAPTPEGISSKSDERQGVMARTQSRVSKALEDTAQDAMASIQNLVGKTMEARTDKDVSMEDLAKQSAEENAKYRESMGITQSLTSSGGMLSAKDDQESAPMTAEIKEMSEMEILARTIEAEAATENYTGKIGVGATIANRAASGKYGDGIKGVILKKGQFSPWNSYTGYAKGEQGKDMLNLKPSSDSYKAAAAILAGDYQDPTGGATHYVNESISKPDWLDEMKNQKRGTKKIGRHLFGNADSNKTYDGKDWITSQVTTSLRPRARP